MCVTIGRRYFPPAAEEKAQKTPKNLTDNPPAADKDAGLTGEEDFYGILLI